ncbi:MAG: NAD(P) transhydrogenase subunit alpha, partial [Stellaceae bacterium]
MIIGIPKERRAGELRVAASPDTVKRLVGQGLAIVVERGAGAGAAYTDDAYGAAGAKLADASAALGADIVLKVQRPTADELKEMKSGAVLVAMLAPLQHKDEVQAYAKAGVTAFAMELVPRITRAQTMDVLSSQANLAGYKAVLDAADYFGRAMPMMMTAAGTVAPARVLVMGAGVAGLQAIATARRLGGVVSATDVRYAAKEQVESLGATFLTVDLEAMKAMETAGGYAKEASEDFTRRQREHVTEALKKTDIVICTALIPGRKAPILITKAMVGVMRTGSVIVDLAVEQGGNVEGNKPDETVVTANGVA